MFVSFIVGQEVIELNKCKTARVSYNEVLQVTEILNKIPVIWI